MRVNEKTKERIEKIKELLLSGKTHGEVAEILGVSVRSVFRITSEHLPTIAVEAKEAKESRAFDPKRIEEIADMVRAGKTIVEIADFFIITKQRVDQLIKKYLPTLQEDVAREKDEKIIKLVELKKTKEEIAEILEISVPTLTKHIDKYLPNLDVKTNVDARRDARAEKDLEIIKLVKAGIPRLDIAARLGANVNRISMIINEQLPEFAANRKKRVNFKGEDLEEMKQKVIKMTNQGFDQYSIGEAIGSSQAYVSRVQRELGISRAYEYGERAPRALTEGEATRERSERNEKIIEQFREGKTQVEIAEEFGISQPQVRLILINKLPEEYEELRENIKAQQKELRESIKAQAKADAREAKETQRAQQDEETTESVLEFTKLGHTQIEIAEMLKISLPKVASILKLHPDVKRPKPEKVFVPRTRARKEGDISERTMFRRLAAERPNGFLGFVDADEVMLLRSKKDKCMFITHFYLPSGLLTKEENTWWFENEEKYTEEEIKQRALEVLEALRERKKIKRNKRAGTEWLTITT
ncbi:MAG: hypothetical protein FWD89_05010 [Firmicutes bacterium]|nr:hypothetical protein [Bacillota bacterium]